MRTVAVMVSLLGLLVPFSLLVHAEECFCLSHASGGILRGCEAYKAPNDAYPTAVCTDPETGKKSQQTMYSYSEWKRIEAGAQGCVCNPVARTAPEVPRSPP
jgi:hypothetical protein